MTSRGESVFTSTRELRKGREQPERLHPTTNRPSVGKDTEEPTPSGVADTCPRFGISILL